ncbi:MAG: protein kinase [Kofleriaceae bacterium]|nr:protein kinase [Kofleriaceae bacterium]
MEAANPVLAEPADDLIDAVLDDRYRILERIGRGGMGRVYRAERIGLGRVVAIKVLDPLGQTSATDRARFAREAMAAGKVDHPNCVGVIDYGVAPAGGSGEAGTPYLVMDYVAGRSLAAELATHGPMPVARAFAIARHLLRGLRHAHGLGLVHRDLTPHNVLLVERDGDPDFARLLDFGLARLMASFSDPAAAQITSTGIVCGTPRYMAPEQGLGQALDQRVDLYALSVVLYELLTGAPPFSADEPIKVVMMHVSQPVPAMATHVGAGVVPAAVEALVRRGLAKAADERPRDAEAYLAELDACEAGLGPAERGRAGVVTGATPAPIDAADAVRLATAATMIGPAVAAAPRRRWPWLVGAAVLLGVGAALLLTGGAGDAPSASQADRVRAGGTGTGSARPAGKPSGKPSGRRPGASTPGATPPPPVAGPATLPTTDDEAGPAAPAPPP